MALLCLQCSELTDDPGPDRSLSRCPSCGDDLHVPADTADALTITITRHELRVLVIWAEFWASKHVDQEPSMQRVIAGVAARIRDQDPKHQSLLFSDELALLADELPGLWTNFPIHRDDRDPRDG